MIQRKYILLQCDTCKRLDDMPLEQYQQYEVYRCPYSNPKHPKMNIVKIHDMEFADDPQPQLNFYQ